MKKLSLILIVLLFGIVAATSAQVPGVPSKPFSVYLDAGLNATSSPTWFKDYHKLGYHAEAGIGFKAFPFIEIVGKAGIQVMAKDWSLIPNSPLDGGNVKILTFGLDARASVGAPLAPIKPFVLAGIGLAKISEDDITSSDILYSEIPSIYNNQLADKTKLYYNIGGGIEFGGGPIKFFIQARYMGFKVERINTPNAGEEDNNIKYIPISFGIKF